MNYNCLVDKLYYNNIREWQKSGLPHLPIHLYIDKMISWLNLEPTKTVLED